jgi:hypothetical protein
LHGSIPTTGDMINQLAQGVTQALQNQPQAPIHVTVQQQAQQQAPPPPAATSRRIPAKDPPEFSGMVEETEGLIQPCELYYVLKQAEFQDLGQWITYVLSFCNKGVAQEWRMALIAEYNANQQVWTFLDRTHFYQRIRTDFGDANGQATAMGKLRTIEQGNRTAQEYAHEFWQYSQVANYGEQGNIQEFKRGLNRGLWMKISDAETVPAVTSRLIDDHKGQSNQGAYH